METIHNGLFSEAGAGTGGLEWTGLTWLQHPTEQITNSLAALPKKKITQAIFAEKQGHPRSMGEPGFQITMSRGVRGV